MGYVNENLLSDERVIHRAHQHWFFIMPPFAWAGVCWLLTHLAGPETDASWFYYLSWFGAIALSLLGLSNLVDRFTSEFAVTDMRVIMKTGLVQRDVLELLLSKVEGVSVKQSISGRIWNFGHVSITGSGGTRSIYKNIRAPMAFRKAIQEQATQTTVAA